MVSLLIYCEIIPSIKLEKSAHVSPSNSIVLLIALFRFPLYFGY